MWPPQGALPMLPLSCPDERNLVQVPVYRHTIGPFRVAERLFVRRLRPTPGRGIDLSILLSMPPCSRHGQPLRLSRSSRGKPLLDRALGYYENFSSIGFFQSARYGHTPSTFGRPKNGHAAALAFVSIMSRSWIYGGVVIAGVIGTVSCSRLMISGSGTT